MKDLQFSGQISLRELDKKPVDLKGAEGDEWVQEILKRSAPGSELICGLDPVQWSQNSQIRFELRVEKIGGDYAVSGAIQGRVASACSRCGDLFKPNREGRFRLILHRLLRDMDPDQEDSGDPDYLYFQGEEIDLIPLLAEQLMVLEPVAECPPFDDLGKCQSCGVIPKFINLADQEAGQKVENSAFSALSKLKLKGD
jgi:uncharacterized metal-binding protein YceD (DUF177 family)